MCVQKAVNAQKLPAGEHARRSSINHKCASRSSEKKLLTYHSLEMTQIWVHCSKIIYALLLTSGYLSLPSGMACRIHELPDVDYLPLRPAQPILNTVVPRQASFIFHTSALRSVCEGRIHLSMNLRAYILPPLAVAPAGLCSRQFCAP